MKTDKKLPKTITVTIPPRKRYNPDTYSKVCGCYLYQALNKAKFPVEAVGGFGRAYLKSDKNAVYEPTRKFSGKILSRNFSKGKDTKVTLRIAPTLNQ